VAGFAEPDLELHVEISVFTVRGKRHEDADDSDRKFLYKGIANRAFERKFNLADHVQVTGADLVNGLLVIQLRREVPEALKPRRIEINSNTVVTDNTGNLGDSRKAA
jgi:molecular chaperone IbpA